MLLNETCRPRDMLVFEYLNFKKVACPVIATPKAKFSHFDRTRGDKDQIFRSLSITGFLKTKLHYFFYLEQFFHGNKTKVFSKFTLFSCFCFLTSV